MSENSTIQPATEIPQAGEGVSADLFCASVLDNARQIGEAYYSRPTDCPAYIEVMACINRIATQRRTPDSDVMATIMEMLRGQSTERPDSLPDPVCIPIETILAILIYRIISDRVPITEGFVMENILSAYSRRRELEATPTIMVVDDGDDVINA